MIEFDRSQLDREHDLGTFKVEEDDLIAYALALGETNPLYVDKEAARQSEFGSIIGSPTFYGMLRTEQRYPDFKLEFGTTGFLAGESSEFFASVKPGDVISAKCKYTDVYEKTGRTGKMVFMIRETIYTNQRGEVVTTVRHSMVRR